MYLLTLLGRSQAYSNQEDAQKHACRYLYINFKDRMGDYRKEFEQSYCRENYSDTLKYWNTVYVPRVHLSQRVYMAVIEKVELDKEFS